MEDRAELLASFFVLVFLGGVYVVYELVAEPRGGHPFGHWIGILGTLLMVLTETLYSSRKRLRRVRWGRLRTWLSFHIFTGIVGPAMVLMHTGLQFRGLAGLTMLLTVLVLASGFLGRYIYTAVPRTITGAVVERTDLLGAAAALSAEIAAWRAGQPARLRALSEHQTAAALALSAGSGGLEVFLRPLNDWSFRLQFWLETRRWQREEKQRARELRGLLRRKQALERQIRTLDAARRLMSLWHLAHVPLGVTLFGSIVIHIIAVFYFGAV
ncbi:MAG: hypothetical protein HY784_00330 [Chloroflexi bacterium]|nr:hypothetical protein [Chloroflexota bacterium]